MNINDWNTIFLIFVLLLIAGYVYLLQERINKLEDRQDIQQKINDSLIETCAKSIRRVANLARGDENAGKRC